MTQAQSYAIAIVIVVLSLALLGPRIAHPTVPTVLLNETVTLTEDEYQSRFNLKLSKGEQVEVRVSTNGQPVDLQVTQYSSSAVLVDQEGQGLYGFEWTPPEEGSYVFTLTADAGTVDATITVTTK